MVAHTTKGIRIQLSDLSAYNGKRWIILI